MNDPKQGKRTVFILGGGAALGAHQAGAMKYLEECGIKPDVLVCSSIGAVNGCVYGSGGVAALEEAWTEFRTLPLLFPSLKENIITGTSLFSLERMARALEEHMDFPKLLESRLLIDIVVLNLSRGLAVMRSNADCSSWEELRSLARAGYAIPPLYGPVRIGAEYFVDGGLAWNVPLDHAIDREADEIFILAPIASKLPYQARFDGNLSYMKRLFDVLWRTIGNTGHLYARILDGKFHDVPVTIIEPGEELSGFNPLGLFHNTPQKAARMINAGYRDAKRALQRPDTKGAVRTLRVAS
jgi:predicted acylesterase/phospholipase RssA